MPKDETPKVEEKKIEKIVKGEVIQRPKGILHKAKTLFLTGSFKSSMGHVVSDVIIPELQNLLFNSINMYAEKQIFGDSIRSRQMPQESRIRYNRPVNRTTSNPWSRGPIVDPRDMEIIEARAYDTALRRPHRATSLRDFDNIIVRSKAEADEIVENMFNCIEKYQVVSLADYKDMLGLETTPIDNKWGWYSLHNTEIRPVREGFLIDLPRLEDI